MKKFIWIPAILLTGCALNYPSLPPLQNTEALSCENIRQEITNTKDLLTEIEIVSQQKDLTVGARIIDNKTKDSAISNADDRLGQLQILLRKKGCN